MNQDNTTADMLNNDEHIKPTAPSGLKVLTVLTFIGCALGLIGAVWGYATAQRNYEGIDKLMEQLNSDSLPAWAKSMIGDPAHIVETITKSYENRIPIALLSLLSVVLCFMGALQMRKLKKQGFLIYVIGELMPFLTLFIFIGAFSFTGIGFYVSACIALLFILLYAMQRKHLVN